MSITIANRPIGSGYPLFIVAEAGVNHNGQLDLALALVDAATQAGADAVKFQTFDTRLLLSPQAETTPEQQHSLGISDARSLLTRLMLPATAWPRLAAYTKQQGLIFLSSAFDGNSLEQLLALGMPAVKVASGEISNPWLIEQAAKTCLPILLSTGASTLEDIDRALGWIASHRGSSPKQTALLHCVSAYPSAPDQSHLRVMSCLAERYQLPVGLSDHSEGHLVSTAAVAAGACIIEKHLTLDRKLEGPDHAMSMAPDDFRAMVQQLRQIERILGDPEKSVMPSERSNRGLIRRGLYAARALPSGTVLQSADLIALRPERGALPASQRDLVIGRKLKRDLAQHTAISESDLR